MQEFLGSLKDINMISITVRVLMSMLCGGGIGIERGRARQPAGMRTYMLVCMGAAAMVMMIGQYLVVASLMKSSET